MRMTPVISLMVGLAASAVAQESEQATEESFIPNFAVGRIGYDWNDTASFSDVEGASMKYQEASVSGNFPILMNDQVKFTGGVRYRYNQVDFGQAPVPFGNETLDLHRIELPFNVWVDQSERWKWWFSVQPGLASDFESIDFDDMTVTALALASYKVSDTLKVAFGGYYSHDLGEARLLPAIGAIYRPNKNWMLALTVPRGEIAYAPTRDWLIAVRAYPSGGGWNVSTPGDKDRDFNYASVKAGIGVDRRLSGRFWGYVEGGVRFAQNVELEGAKPSFDHDLDTTAYANVGIKVRF
ncbi:DUF6268 family outer membrane beta-barrel protein [Sulfuriroseicoccus oceanibius]|uniref:DUF6268 domain-containing protein n=1 Tax=Sulfuriroseicoccus oceanibius TaxID=2707525 RepID=A0A6B3L2C3_9BACT|nr:DUF6268 family outer membrane beta-barrel protein [Sulfuriroseicoccus oceanibius]QQL44117.1 hypothetical protein G3M56_009440 [Sulfuriroseicoccus oceanibius]